MLFRNWWRRYLGSGVPLAAVTVLAWSFTSSGAAAAPDEVRFRASPPAEDLTEWRREFRTALAEVLGLAHVPRAPAGDARVTGRVDAGPYVREHVALQVEPGVWAPAYVYTPTHGRPAATVIALHGHGPGKSLTIGLVRTAGDRVGVQEHERDFGRQAAMRGYAVIVPDQRGFGERMHPEDVAAGALDSCIRSHADALGKQRSLTGERVHDVRAWITYAGQRPEMDASRLALLGHSAGGATALFTAALDERVRVAVVSGYFGTWEESIFSLPHCICNEVPRLQQLARMEDIATLIAPRPLLISLGADDEWMPAEPARRAFVTVDGFFRHTGGGPAVLTFGAGGHRVYGAHVWPFLATHLPPTT